MSELELTRYRIDPSRSEELTRLWPLAVEAIRRRCPGLLEANLVRLDEHTFLDAWRWESREAALAAAAVAPSIPEAATMFALITEPPIMEHGTVLRYA